MLQSLARDTAELCVDSREPCEMGQIKIRNAVALVRRQIFENKLIYLKLEYIWVILSINLTYGTYSL